MRRRRIAVVSTSRADYGHLRWPLRLLQEDPSVDLQLILAGAHLSPEFGLTSEEVVRDGFPIAERLECLLSSDTDVGMAKTIGLATLSFADALGRVRPDLLVLIADRYEMLAPASVALALRIPIVHIEGGELSAGAIDEAVRNALTKMSHLHLTTTRTARERVIAMGEEPWRVHQVGAASLDHMSRCALPARDELERVLGFSLDPAPVLVTYHPVTLARDTTVEADALYAALGQLSGPILFCFPNADAGSRELIARAARVCGEGPDRHLVVNLGHVHYWGLLHHARAVVGNSSSGIMETASIPVPAVDIGLRQRGRERARNVIDTEADRDAIVRAVTRALAPSFRESLRGLENPYGDGRAAERIHDIVTTTPLDDRLIRKAPVPVR
jgi:UDP-hydrolysing UDP-N-acetyl-D-glucosamine 2-epimerase